MIRILSQFRLLIALLLIPIFVGCASAVTVDPTMTKITTSYASGPGADGATTSRSDLYEVNPPLTAAEVKMVKSDPVFLQKLLTSGRMKIDAAKYAVHASQPLAQQLVAAGFNAVTANLLSYAVQSRLQRNQQEFCQRNGCDKGPTFNNINHTLSGASSALNSSNTLTSSSQPSCVNQGNCGK